MREIGAAVEEGAQAYLTRQFKTLGIFVVLVFGLLLLLPAPDWGVKMGRSGFFIVGALFSASIGYLGMKLATKANVRVAAASRGENGRDEGMRIAFRTGGTVGMATVGLGLLGASIVVLLYKAEAPKVLEGFGFGAALLAMFMRVGGGIFTKAADVGADLVGKVEAGIPEDDPRNAATIADNVGDNVGDCAGMAADLFESYAVMLVAALILGSVAFGSYGLVFPLLVPALGAITALIGVFITKARGTQSALDAINQGFYISAAIAAVLCSVAAWLYLPATFAELGSRDQAIGAPRWQPAHHGDPRRDHRHRPRGGHPVAHRLLHRHRQASDQGRRTHVAHGCGHGRPLGHRRRPRVGRLHRRDHRWRGLPRLPPRRWLGRPVAVPHRARRLWSADHRRCHRRHGHVRSGLRQRAGHRRDVR